MVTQREQQSQTEEKLKNMLRNTLLAFEEIYTVDLEHNYYRMIYPEIEYMEEGEYENSIEEHICSGRIITEDEERIRRFLSIEGIRQNLKEENYVEQKYRRTLENGRIVWCLTCLTVLERAKGVPVTIIMAIRNIENLIAQEEQQKEQLHKAMCKAEEANLAKTDFLSRMSHDIRTPMNTIIGMTEIAKNHLDDKERVLDCFRKITLASNHLLALINEVLDMSKIDIGKMTLRKESFCLKTLLDDLIAMVKNQMNEKNHQLNFQIGNLEHTYLIGDSLRIQQIFMNLVSNAMKYTPEGGKISIQVTEQWETGRNYSNYIFVFQDNGIGMSKEFMERIFEPYEREKNARVEKIQGTGLGMYISHNFVKMMGGNIQVESKEGAGSRFTVTVPLEHDMTQTEKQKEQRQQAESYLEKWKKTDFTGKRILLVEDNDFNLEIAQVMLESVGIQVVIAKNGMEAVQCFQSQPQGYFHMIFMDIQMPGINGYEATKRIRSVQRPDAKRIPIIAMTADVFAEDIQAAKSAGMNEHMAKPLDVEKLSKILCHWLLDKEREEK